MMISKTHEFMKINKNGVFLINVCGGERRYIYLENGNMMLNSMESFNYLKIDEANSLMFDDTKQDETIIRITQEHNSKNNIEDNIITSYFEQVYNLRL